MMSSYQAQVLDQFSEVLGQGLAADWDGSPDVAQGWTAEWELAAVELGVRPADLMLT